MQFIRRKSKRAFPCLDPDRRRRRRESRRQGRNGNQNQVYTGRQDTELTTQHPLPQPEPANQGPSIDTPQPTKDDPAVQQPLLQPDISDQELNTTIPHHAIGGDVPFVDPEVLPEAPVTPPQELASEATSEFESLASTTRGIRRGVSNMNMTGPINYGWTSRRGLNAEIPQLSGTEDFPVIHPDILPGTPETSPPEAAPMTSSQRHPRRRPTRLTQERSNTARPKKESRSPIRKQRARRSSLTSSQIENAISARPEYGRKISRPIERFEVVNPCTDPELDPVAKQSALTAPSAHTAIADRSSSNESSSNSSSELHSSEEREHRSRSRHDSSRFTEEWINNLLEKPTLPSSLQRGRGAHPARRSHSSSPNGSPGSPHRGRRQGRRPSTSRSPAPNVLETSGSPIHKRQGRRCPVPKPLSTVEEAQSPARSPRRSYRGLRGTPNLPGFTFGGPGALGNLHPRRQGPSSEDNAAQSAKYRQKGANYSQWIDKANDADCKAPCKVKKSDVSWNDLVNPSSSIERWVTKSARRGGAHLCVRSKPEVRPAGLPMGDQDYLSESISCRNTEGINMHMHSMGPGVIFTEMAHRDPESDTHHWSEIALAQYRRGYDIDTLRHIHICNCVNSQTLNHILEVIYPRLGRSRQSEDVITLDYGTDEYNEIMGVTWGSAVGALVLGAWDRGTRRITRILIWQGSFADSFSQASQEVLVVDFVHCKGLFFE
ncbi:hypothetical protein PENANT_c047G02534 [Penicillium antarcticum]|uniref:Uncharacterized protein n=1 Tax=Penicillium antarcticum TaxID=416450 RepID=A0A1V6PRH2_9EURO|nr:hypothetical protein PENANT_c047G02534 [Penicillium antarcticum]